MIVDSYVIPLPNTILFKALKVILFVNPATDDTFITLSHHHVRVMSRERASHAHVGTTLACHRLLHLHREDNIIVIHRRLTSLLSADHVMMFMFPHI